MSKTILKVPHTTDHKFLSTHELPKSAKENPLKSGAQQQEIQHPHSDGAQQVANHSILTPPSTTVSFTYHRPELLMPETTFVPPPTLLDKTARKSCWSSKPEVVHLPEVTQVLYIGQQVFDNLTTFCFQTRVHQNHRFVSVSVLKNTTDQDGKLLTSIVKHHKELIWDGREKEENFRPTHPSAKAF